MKIDETPPINSYVFYKSFFEATRELYENGDYKSYAEANYYLHNYAFNNVIPDLSKTNIVVRSIFPICSKQIEASIKNYQQSKKCGEFGKLGAEFGKLGGRPKKNKDPAEGLNEKPPEGLNNNPLNINSNVNDNDNVTVNENDNNFDNDCAAREPLNIHNFYLKKKLAVLPYEFFKYNEKHGWEIDGKPIENWQGAYLRMDAKRQPDNLKHIPDLEFDLNDYEVKE